MKNKLDIGCRVLFYPSPLDIINPDPFISHRQIKARAAIVADICGPDLVNLTVFDSHGRPHGRTHVLFVQDSKGPTPEGNYATWAPTHY